MLFIFSIIFNVTVSCHTYVQAVGIVGYKMNKNKVKSNIIKPLIKFSIDKYYI